MILFLLLGFTGLVSLGSAHDGVLYHRVFHPDIPAQPFAQRATLDLVSQSLIPFPDLYEDLKQFESILKGIPNPENALYQVALQLDENASYPVRDFSSAKACHLTKVTAETIVFHLSHEQEPLIFALDYFVSPVPRDGSCPKSSSKKTSSIKAFSHNFLLLNSTVVVNMPQLPPTPELHAPPTLTPEGEAIKPQIEKSFIQKYWVYIVVLTVVLLLGTGSEEPEQARRNQ